MKIHIFCGYRERGLWWFRVFGWGIRWKRVSQHSLPFSERELGHGLMINGWHFEFLRRSDMRFLKSQPAPVRSLVEMVCMDHPELDPGEFSGFTHHDFVYIPPGERK